MAADALSASSFSANLRLTLGVQSGREWDRRLDRPGAGRLTPWGRRVDIIREVSVVGRHGES